MLTVFIRDGSKETKPIFCQTHFILSQNAYKQPFLVSLSAVQYYNSCTVSRSVWRIAVRTSALTSVPVYPVSLWLLMNENADSFVSSILPGLLTQRRWFHTHTHMNEYIYIYIYIYIYTGCPRRNVPDFGRVFLMLKYTDITQNTYIQSWTVTEIMARDVWNFDSCYTLIDYQIHIKTGRNMWFL